MNENRTHKARKYVMVSYTIHTDGFDLHKQVQRIDMPYLQLTYS